MGKGKGKARNPTWHTVNLMENLTALGFNPISELVKELSMIDDAKDRADILLKLMEYIFPKRKAVDITATTTQTQVSLSPQQLAGLLSSDLFRQAIPVPSEQAQKPVEAKPELIEADPKLPKPKADPFA